MTLKYVWLDLETTGTDEHLDPILEVGIVITDDELNELDDRSYIIKPLDGWQSRLNDYVRDMHTRNGLLADVETYGEPIAEVEEYLELALSHHGKKHDFILAGSGVAHFDRRFLEAQMPEFTKWLKYYCIDVGVMRRVLCLCGREDLLIEKQEKNHRALDDALYHLEELRHIRAALAKPAAS